MAFFRWLFFFFLLCGGLQVWGQTATPTIDLSSAQCIVSDTTHNLVYVNPANCAPSTIQPTPPPDSGNLSWTDPNYDTASAGNWTAPVSAWVGPWVAPCNLPGSNSNTMWIGFDPAGNNPCGYISNYVVNEYFRNVFSLYQGCTVTAASLNVAEDNYVDIWLNGTQVGSGIQNFGNCTVVPLDPGLFQQGNNVLAFDVMNGPYYPSSAWNPQGLTYEMCFNLSCNGSPTPTLTYTPTPTITLTPTDTYTPTSSSTPTYTLTPVPSICVIAVATLTTAIGVTWGNTVGVETDGTYIYESEYATGKIQVFQYSNNAPVTSYAATTPLEIRLGPDGSLYYIGGPYNPRVYVVNPLTGAAVTNFGYGLFTDPRVLAFDAAGRLYVSDFMANRVIQFTSTGGVWSASATFGSGVLSYPDGIGFDTAGNMYVGDGGNHRVTVFSPTGAVLGYWGTGLFNFEIWEVRFDGNGDLWATDRQGNRVVVFNPSGTPIGTLGPSAGGVTIADLCGLTFGPAGDVFVSESESYSRIDRFTLCTPLPTATSTPTANTPTTTSTLTATSTPTVTATFTPTAVPTVCVLSATSFNSGTAGAFNDVAGDTVAGGLIYETEYTGNRVQVFQYSNNAPVTSFSVNTAIGIRKGPDGYLYIAEGHFNPHVLVMDASTGAAVTTLTHPLFVDPRGIAFDTAGNLYVGDYASGVVLKFTQSGGVWSASATIGSGTIASAEGIAFDASGNIYVGDPVNHRIDVFDPSGSNPRAWGTGLFQQDISDLQFDGNGNLWADDRQNNRILEFNGTGALIGILGPSVGGLTFNNPSGVALGPNGDLVVGESNNNRVDRITLCAALPTFTLTPVASPPTATLTPTITPTITATANWGGAQCLVSDTAHNLMYFNTANCSGVTLQPTPPPDAGNLSWLDPNYNTGSVSGWNAPVLASVGGWVAPCNLNGSNSNTSWMGYDSGGNNPCGGGPNTVNEYFRNAFTLPPGCAVTAANLTVSEDNGCLAWFNGAPIGDNPIQGFQVCNTYSIPVSLFQAGNNVLTFEVYNYPVTTGPGANPQALTYEMCYAFSCGSATPTASPNLTATSVSTATSSPTFSPSLTVTATTTPTPSPTASMTPTSTVTASLTASPSASPTFTATNSPTFSPSLTATASPTPTPTFTGTSTSTATPFRQPTLAVTSTPSAVVIGPPYPNPIRGPGPVVIPVAVPGTAPVECSIFTTAFRKIRQIDLPVTGNGALSWDLADNYGIQVANGIYYIRFQVTVEGKATTKILKVIVLSH